MNIYVVGMNYKKTPIEIREKLSFEWDEYENILNNIKNTSGVDECSFISTCNRTEIHIYSEGEDLSISNVEEELCSAKNLNIYNIKKYLYVYEGLKAIKHIFKVAAGMDSLIKGEDQILGQFKRAYEISGKNGSSGAVLNTLSRYAITLSKKVKTYTINKRKGTTIAAVTYNLLEGIYKRELKSKQVLIIGSGEIGKLVLKELREKGMDKIEITKRNRSGCRGNSCVDKYYQVINYYDRYVEIDSYDIVISATSSPHYTITRDILEKHLKDTDRLRVYIDLAVPRDIDESINDIGNIKYYNIDNLRSDKENISVNDILDMDFIEQEIEKTTIEFEKWFSLRKMLPMIEGTQEYADKILRGKLQNEIPKLSFLEEQDRDNIESLISEMVNKVLNKLIYDARKYNDPGELDVFLRCMDRIIRNEQ